MMLKPQLRKLASPFRAVTYLFAKTDSRGVTRKNVELIRGSPAVFIEVANGLTFSKRYSSLVIGFAPSDAPTPLQVRRFIKDFERTAFPGISTRVCWLVVLHESADSLHLHVLVASVDLLSGKQFSVLAHGARPLRALCEAWNFEMHWDSMHDPFRAPLVAWSEEVFVAIDTPGRLLPIGTEVHEHARRLVISAVLAGKVNSQVEVRRELSQMGEVVRSDSRSITVDVHGTQTGSTTRKTHVRFSGLLYSKNFDLALMLKLLAPTPLLPRFWKRNDDDCDLALAVDLRVRNARNIAARAMEFQRRLGLSRRRARLSIVTDVSLTSQVEMPALKVDVRVIPGRQPVMNPTMSLTYEPQSAPLSIDAIHFDSGESVPRGSRPSAGREGVGAEASRAAPAGVAAAFQGAFRNAFDAIVDRILRRPIERLRRRVGSATRTRDAANAAATCERDLERANAAAIRRAARARELIPAPARAPGSAPK